MICSTLHECLPARVSVGLLVASGVMVLYMTRINLSVAIVAMVHTPPASSSASSTHSNPADDKAYCERVNLIAPPSGNISSHLNGTGFNATGFQLNDEIDLTDQLVLTGPQKGMILGAFYYGYFITNIPGGRLAEMYGTKKVFGGSILISGLLTLLTPVATKANYMVLIVIRILIGIAQGVVYPSLHVLVARWIPPNERSRFISITYMCNCLGTIITLPTCGVIIAAIGWPPVFYITGGVSLLWVILWAVLMYDSPRDHPRISEKEKEYILKAISEGTTQQKPDKTPWLKFMTSMPLWAITIAHMASMFGFTLLLTLLPTYMDSILGFSIKSNGILSALPFLAQFLGSSASGFIADYLITRNIVTLPTSRKIFATVCLVCPATFLVIIGYVGCNVVVAVGFFTICAATIGALGAGQLANHLDLSPNFAGTLLGVSNTIAFAVSMLAPIIVGALTPDQTLQQWQIVFWLTGTLYISCWLFYMIFSRFEIQPWNFQSKESNSKNVEEQHVFISQSVKPQILEKKDDVADDGL